MLRERFFSAHKICADSLPVKGNYQQWCWNRGSYRPVFPCWTHPGRQCETAGQCFDHGNLAWRRRHCAKWLYQTLCRWYSDVGGKSRLHQGDGNSHG